MPIAYPIILPNAISSPTSRGITIHKRSAVANAASPFTYQAQTYIWPGQLWLADISLPPMSRANAETWCAALSSLNGLEGSFLLGDSANKTPRGVGTGTPLINGASQSGYDIITDGWTANQNGILKAGDWIQLGRGNTSRLYKVVVDANTGYNLLLRSNDFGNASWSKFHATINSSVENNPVTGSMSVDQFSEDATTNTHGALQSVTLGAVQQTLFADVKPNGRDFFAIQLQDSAAAVYFAIFNITLGTVTTQSGCTGTIASLGNGFYRCSLVTTGVVAAGAGTIYGVICSTNAIASYAGDVTKGCYLAQMQTSPGSAIGPLIVTKAAAITDTTAATITVWPQLRTSPADNDVITVNNARSKFMLMQDAEWSIDEAHIYGLNFSAVEDMRP